MRAAETQSSDGSQEGRLPRLNPCRLPSTLLRNPCLGLKPCLGCIFWGTCHWLRGFLGSGFLPAASRAMQLESTTQPLPQPIAQHLALRLKPSPFNKPPVQDFLEHWSHGLLPPSLLLCSPLTPSSAHGCFLPSYSLSLSFCGLQNSHVTTLTPSVSECDCIWRHGL